jgi:signal transduction histidine kinase
VPCKLTRRDLLVDPVAVFVPALDVPEQVAHGYAARMYGVVALQGDHYEHIQLAPLLWLIVVPHEMLPHLQHLARLALAAVVEAMNYREYHLESSRVAERLAREFEVTRDDYNRVAGRLQGKLAELQRAKQALQVSEAELREANDELERRVAARTAELEAVNRELESFSYSVSHDLRAPLRAINGFSHILREDFLEGLPTQAHGYLERILAATDRMDQLINDFLALSKAANKTLDQQWVDIGALAEAVYASLQLQTEGRAVCFSVAPRMQARADERLLKLVLENLLGNAVKLTRGRTPAEISVGEVPEAPQPTFFVRDNGAGFDMHNPAAQRLFAPFQRMHTEREFEGTGIGLATARRVIARHGGSIWAESAVDAGATFFFSLPE